MSRVDFDNSLSLAFSDDRPLEDVCGRLSNWTGLLLHKGYDLSSQCFYEGRIFAMSIKVERRDNNLVFIDLGFGYGEEDMAQIQICLLCCLLEVLYRRLEIKEAQILKGKRTIADYCAHDRVLYDRISEKAVSQPEHLIDLYLRAS